MNAIDFLGVADHAQWVLELAEKQATTPQDWAHINQLSSGLVNGLFSISEDTMLREDIRQKAEGLRFALRETMRISCGQVEALGGFKYPEHRPNNLTIV